MSAKPKLVFFEEDNYYQPALCDDTDNDLTKWLLDTNPIDGDQIILSQAAQNVIVEVQNGTDNLSQDVQSTTGNYNMPQDFDISQNVPEHHPHGNFLPILSPGPFHVQNVAGNVLKKVRPKSKKQGLVPQPRDVITADNVPRDAGNVPGRMRVVIELSPNLNGSKFDFEIKEKISINTLRRLLVDNGKLPADVKCLFSHNKLKVLKAMGRSPRWHGVKDGDVLYVFRAQDNKVEV